VLFRLILLLTIVPIVELALLLKLAEWIGGWSALAIVLVTGILGAVLAKYEGLRCFARIQRELAGGRLPGKRLIDAVLILVAGALLVTPGVLTDIAGFCLLIPPTRSVIRQLLIRRFEGRLRVFTTSVRPTDHTESDPRVVEGSVSQPTDSTKKEGA
jgi:UPF0716 protein FxsA